MDKLPSFDELKKLNEPPKPPSFDELVKMQQTPEKPKAPPSFEELVKLQQEVPKPPSFAELQRLQEKLKQEEVRKKREEMRAQAPKKEKPVHVKVRTATPLDDFRREMKLGDNSLFYAYVRMEDENNSYRPGPKGGVAFLVNIQPDNKFEFSFAVCAVEDSFVFDTARELCQRRFRAGMTMQIEGYGDDMPVIDAISIALEKYIAGEQYGSPSICRRTTFITDSQIRRVISMVKKYYYGE
jgi:hypothetical protein